MPQSEPSPGNYPVFQWEEIKKAITQLPNSKAPGPNGLPGDLLKHQVDFWAPTMTQYINAVMRSGIPDSWSDSIIVPIFKKGSRDLPSCYRPISLVDVEVKIVGRVILNQLQTWAAKIGKSVV